MLGKGEVEGKMKSGMSLGRGSERRSVCLETAARGGFLGDWGWGVGNTYTIYTASFYAIPVPAVPSAPCWEALHCNTWQISRRRTPVESDFPPVLLDHNEAVPLPLAQVAQLDPGRLVFARLSLPRNPGC